MPSDLATSSVKQSSGCCCSNSESPASVKNWCGYAISRAKFQAGACVNKVVDITETVFVKIGNLFLLTNETAAVCRKLQKYTLNMIAHITNTHGKYDRLLDIFRRYVAFVDFVQFAGDVDYFVNKGWKASYRENSDHSIDYKPADSKTLICSRIAMAIADVTGAFLWLESMAFINLSKAAAAVANVRIFSYVPQVVASIPVLCEISALEKAANALGNLRVFSFATKISPLSLCLRSLDLMYAFFALDAAQRVVNAETRTHRISAGFDLSSYLADLTLSAVIGFGVTNVFALGLMGASCIALALNAHFYRESHGRELKPQPPQSLQDHLAATV